MGSVLRILNFLNIKAGDMIFDFRLKVFYTVSQKLSFTKAAEALFISQPAVTKHIKELEEQLSTSLFKR